MAYERIFDHDPDAKITEIYHFDPETGGFVIETRQDVTDLIELNKTRFNDADGKWGEMTLVASYPLTILMELVKQNILDPGFRVINDKAYRNWLNAPENRVWRTRPGRV